MPWCDTHIPERIGEDGKPYKCTADDSAYATFELDNGVIAHFNSSWTVRVRRDDLLTLQVDGTQGSALLRAFAGAIIQPYGGTPRPARLGTRTSTAQSTSSTAGSTVPTNEVFDNGFKTQWEMFLKHCVDAENYPFPYDLREGAKGVQLAELGIESWNQRKWLEVPKLASK